jgi:hypothetical protein
MGHNRASPFSRAMPGPALRAELAAQAVRCQGFNGPRGPLGLGLGIRSSPCLGLSNSLYLKRGDVSI